MATSLHFVLRDLDTGAARTGLTVKLYNHLDNFADPVLEATEVSGHEGVYEFTYTSFIVAKYRLKVNGSFESSFANENGTWLYDGDSIITLNAADRWDFKSKRAINIADPVDTGDAVNRGWALGQFYTKSQINDLLALLVTKGTSQLITALKTFEILPRAVPTDALPGVLPDPLLDGDFIHLKYLNQILSGVSINPYPQFVKVIRVHPGATAVRGKLYPTIQAAVAYAFTQTPAVNKQYAILIEGMPAGQEFITAESGSLKSYVHLISVSKHIKMVIADNSLSANTSISNATLFFGAGVITSARTYNQLKCLGCDIYNYRDIQFNNGALERCKAISDSGYKIKVQNDCNVEYTIFSATPEKVTHTGAFIAEEYSGYAVPVDPTIPA